MIELTAEARQKFDDYLARMRSALRGTRAVEAAEVEQNVREHVELALSGSEGPVGPRSGGTALHCLLELATRGELGDCRRGNLHPL